MDLRGAYTALVTPFSKSGINEEGFLQSIEFQQENGITGLLACGTTGESPTLTSDEKHRLFELLSGHGKGTRIAGTGGNNTSEVLSKTKLAHELGYEASLLVDCYYNGPSSLELRNEYYSVVASAFPEMQMIPYVIPGRSGCELTVEDLAILHSKHRNISSVKEATGNLDRMRRTREICGDKLSILSGDDDKTFEMMRDATIGASGVISVASNVAPKAVSQLCAALSKGNAGEASDLNDALSPLFSVITVKTSEQTKVGLSNYDVPQKFRNPLPYKVLMNGLGMPSGTCRQPLGKMSKKGVEAVRTAAQLTWELNPEILQPVADFYDVDIEKRISDDANWGMHYA